MPVTITSPLSDAHADEDANFYDARGDLADDVMSEHTANLYSDLDDELSEADAEILNQDNNLEREYFESLDVKDATPNETFAECPALRGKTLSPIEETHFHSYNVTPNRPCSAFFKCDTFMAAGEVFDALKKEGFQTQHIRCLQRKPSGEIFVTFRTAKLRDEFLKRSLFVCQKRSFAVNDAERPLTFLTIYDAPYELPDTAIIRRLGTLL